MRSFPRTLLYGLPLALALTGARVTSAPVPTAELAGFGGAVLVGDGEVFVGEAANQFRPGMVYIYRKAGTGWQEAATLTGPKSAVGDRFGIVARARRHAPVRRRRHHAPCTSSRSRARCGRIAIDRRRESWCRCRRRRRRRRAGARRGACRLPQPNAARFGVTRDAASGDWLLVGKEVAGGGRGADSRRSAVAGGGGADAPAQPAGAVFAFKRDGSGQYTYQSTIVVRRRGDARRRQLRIGRSRERHDGAHRRERPVESRRRRARVRARRRWRVEVAAHVRADRRAGQRAVRLGDRADRRPGRGRPRRAMPAATARCTCSATSTQGGRTRAAAVRSGRRRGRAAAAAARPRGNFDVARKSRASPRPPADAPIASARRSPPTTRKCGSARLAPAGPAACSSSRATRPASRSTACRLLGPSWSDPARRRRVDLAARQRRRRRRHSAPTAAAAVSSSTSATRSAPGANSRC